MPRAPIQPIRPLFPPWQRYESFDSECVEFSQSILFLQVSTRTVMTPVKPMPMIKGGQLEDGTDMSDDLIEGDRWRQSIVTRIMLDNEQPKGCRGECNTTANIGQHPRST